MAAMARVYRYTNHSVITGYYTPPDGATAALKKDFSGKWTEDAPWFHARI